MTVVFVIVAVLVIAGVAMAATGRLGELPANQPDRRPDGAEPAFDVVARGYRMDEVDDTIDALRARISALEAERRR